MSIYVSGGGGGGRINDQLTSATTTWSSQRLASLNAASVQLGGDATLRDLTLTGDLVVGGTTTHLNSTVIDAVDETIELNSDRHAITEGGLRVLRGVADDSALLWNVANARWEASATGAAAPFYASVLTAAGGTAAAPSINFSNDPDTGLYRGVGANSICFSAGGVCQIEVESGSVKAASGVVLHTNTIDETSAGAGVTVDSVLLRDGTVSVAGGSAAAPGVSFNGDPNTGLYSAGADQVNVAAGGTLAASFTTSAVTIPASRQFAALGAADVAGVLTVSVGSAAAPGVSFNGDPNTGLYSAGADQVNVSTGGSPALTLTNSAVTVSASRTLTTLGNANIGGYLDVAIGTAAAPGVRFNNDSNTGLYWVGADQLGITAGGVQRLSVSTSDVTSGVPMLAPAGSTATPSVAFSTDPGTGLYSVAAGQLGIAMGGANRLTVSSGSVTVAPPVLGSGGSAAAPTYSFQTSTSAGVYSPSTNVVTVSTAGVDRLTVGTAAIDGAVPIRSAGGSAASPGFSFSGDSNTGLISASPDVLGFVAGGVQRASIGTTIITSTLPIWGQNGSAAAPAYSFSAATNRGVFSSGAGLGLVSGGGSSMITVQNLGGCLFTGDASANTNGLEKLGTSGRRWAEVWCTQSAINTASDSRVKHDVTDATLGLDFVRALRPVTYTLNDEVTLDEAGTEIARVTHSRRHEGLIAQEVKIAIEAAGLTTALTDIVGIDPHPEFADGLHSIRYGVLVMPLIKAVQELAAENSALAARVAALESP